METVTAVQGQIVSLITEHPYLVLAGACVTSLALYLSTRRSGPKALGPRDTLVVHGNTDPDVPALSPFVLKLEVYLRLAKVPYEVGKAMAFSSKGQVPWISYNEETIADSHFAIEWVKKKYDVDLNKGLNTEQKAVARAFKHMMENFHFWAHVYFRFYEVDDPVLVKNIPPYLIRFYLRRTVIGYMHGQGIGRHTKEEILQFFADNLKNVQDFLGEKQFLMGDEPTEVDCSVFPLLVGLHSFMPAELKRLWGSDCLPKQYPKLYAYFLRMKELTYPNFKGE